MAERPRLTDPDSPSALLRACAENASRPLIASLLDLPIAWDLSERSERSDLSGKTAAGILLSSWHRGHDSGSEPLLAAWPSLSPESALAAEMVERGASPIFPADPGASPVACAAATGRADFLAAIASHPDFSFPKILPLLSFQKTELLSAACASGLIDVARILVETAGWPVNRQDKDGRFPLGYAQTLEMSQALLNLGADPSLPDAEGLNAIARAQSIRDTSAREAVVSALAKKMREAAPGAESLADLARGNEAALFQAAQNAPKSTLSQLLKAFRFDPSKLRDPRTGRTPLMAALLGGRQANARELAGKGCSINDQDADGVSAAAYMLLGADANSTWAAPSRGFADFARLEMEIDWSAVCSKGYPVALQPLRLFGLMKKDPYQRDYRQRLSGCLALAAHCGADLSSLRMPDGAPFASGYLAAAPQKPEARAAEAIALLQHSVSAGQPDGAMLCAAELFSSGSRPYEMGTRDFKAALASAAALPADEASAPFLAKAAASIGPAAREALGRDFPEYLAAIERAEISTAAEAAGPGSRKPKGL